MLWIGKVKDPFTGDIGSEYLIDASDYYEAKTELLVKVSSNSFLNSLLIADVDCWVEPADDQPEEEKFYCVQAGNQPTLYHWYADTYEEAVEQADYAATCYDFVEILYGWPGHWQPVDDDPERSEKDDQNSRVPQQRE